MADNYYDQFLESFALKTDVPVWVKNLYKTLASKNITLEDWNTLVAQARSISAESEAIYDYIKALEESGYVVSVQGPNSPEPHQGVVVLSLNDDFGITLTPEVVNDIPQKLQNLESDLQNAVDALEDTKLDKSVTGGFAAYTHVGSTQTQTIVSQSALNGAIVQRTSGGQITVPATPSNNKDATSKEYVDSKSEILTEAIESLAEDVEINTDNITDLSGKVENLYNSSSALIMPNHEFMQEPSGKLMYQARNRNCTDEELEERVFELENNVAAINESFTDLQEQVLYIDNDLENTNEEVIELQNEVSELRGLVSILIGVSPIMVEPHGDFMYDPQNSLMLNN